MVNAFAYAPSQLIAMRDTEVGEPRSTCHHWVPEKALAHRVPLLPSTASEAREAPATSVDEAVAVLPCDTTTSAALALCVVATRREASRPNRPAVIVANRTGDRHRRRLPTGEVMGDSRSGDVPERPVGEQA